VTPEEVFAQLRDVHRPNVDPVLGAGLDLRPLVIFGACVVIVIGLRAVMRWQRNNARLGQVNAAQPPAEQRDHIAKIVRKGRRRRVRTPVPAAFFVPPSKVTVEDAADLRRWARQRLK